MLFLGNVKDSSINYKELSDLSLRIYPKISQEKNIGNVNYQYVDNTGGYEYYNAKNIYNYLGYWNNELYRFGIVYILDNYELSPVFNVMGCSNLTDEVDLSILNIPLRVNDQRVYINTDKENYKFIYNDDSGNVIEKSELNTKGVIRINSSKSQIDDLGVTPIGIKFSIPADVL